MVSYWVQTKISLLTPYCSFFLLYQRAIDFRSLGKTSKIPYTQLWVRNRKRGNRIRLRILWAVVDMMISWPLLLTTDVSTPSFSKKSGLVHMTQNHPEEWNWQILCQNTERTGGWSTLILLLHFQQQSHVPRDFYVPGKMSGR